MPSITRLRCWLVASWLSRVECLLLAPVVAVLLCLTPARAADAGEAMLVTSVQEVRIAFAVSDANGRPVHSLQSADVAVVDNGWIIRHFRSFRAAGESPLDLVLLLDASGSVESQLAGEISDARSFLEATARTPHDRVSILVFGGVHPRLLCLRNCPDDGASVVGSALRANGLTPLFDALVHAEEILRTNPDPELRPAMVLFSDGRDTVSMHSLREALDGAETLAAPIYTVNVCRKGCESDEGDAVLADLAAQTGGLSFAPGQKIQSTLSRVLEDLHSGYVLTYTPLGPPQGWHSLRLLPASDATLRFRSRRAYDDSPGED